MVDPIGPRRSLGPAFLPAGDKAFERAMSNASKDIKSEGITGKTILAQGNAAPVDGGEPERVRITTPEGVLQKAAPVVYGLGLTLDPSLTGAGKPIILILSVKADAANNAVKRAIGQGDVRALQQLVDPENLSLYGQIGNLVGNFPLAGGPLEVGRTFPGTPQLAPLPGGQSVVAFANTRSTVPGPGGGNTTIGASVNGGVGVSIPYSGAAFDAGAKAILSYAASNNALALAGPGGAAAFADDIPLSSLAALIGTGKLFAVLGYGSGVQLDTNTGDVLLRTGKTTFEVPAKLLPQVAADLFGPLDELPQLPPAMRLKVPDAALPLADALVAALVASGKTPGDAIAQAEETYDNGGHSALAEAIPQAAGNAPDMDGSTLAYRDAFRTRGMGMDAGNFAAIAYQRLLDGGIGPQDAWATVWSTYASGRDVGTPEARSGLVDGGYAGGREALRELAARF